VTTALIPSPERRPKRAGAALNRRLEHRVVAQGLNARRRQQCSVQASCLLIHHSYLLYCWLSFTATRNITLRSLLPSLQIMLLLLLNLVCSISFLYHSFSPYLGHPFVSFALGLFWFCLKSISSSTILSTLGSLLTFLLISMTLSTLTTLHYLSCHPTCPSSTTGYSA